MHSAQTRDRMVDVLIEAGIRRVFTFPGLGITWLAPAFYERRNEIEVVLGRSEQSASIMAQAYGRLTDTPGVFMAQGPWAATTGAFGCLEAFFSGTPMMFVACTSDYDGMGQYGVYQSMTGDYGAGDVKGSISHLSKYACLAGRPEEAIFGMQMALKHCNTPRKGVGALVFKTDFVREDFPQATKGTLYPTEGYLRYTPPEPNQAALDALATMISEADNPVIIAGFGVRQDGGSGGKLLQLARKIGAAVVTSPNGKSVIDETADVCGGTLGTFGGTRAAHRLVAEADMVLVLGASLGADYTRFRDPNLIRPGEQKIAQVDIDPRNSGWVVPVDLPITADAGDVIDDLLDRQWDEAKRQARMGKLGSIKRDNGYDDVIEFDSSPGTVHYVDIFHAMNRYLQEDDLLVTDAGNNSIWCKHIMRCRTPGQYITPGGTGAMGWGPPAAVGTKMAFPDKRVTMIAGDGGFMMTMDAVATAKQYNLPITFVVLNNSGLGMVRDNQLANKVFCDLDYVDFAAMANSMGAIGVKVDTVGAYLDALSEAHKRASPTVIEVALDPEARHFDAIDSEPLVATTGADR